MQIEAADAGRAPAASPKLRLAGDALLRDAVQRVASRGMYVPSWPGLNPRLLFRAGPAREPLFPLNAPHRTYAYVARSLIYHLFRTLSMGNGSTVLVPDYHHGNEIRAIRAAGATLRFYRIGGGQERRADAGMDPQPVERAGKGAVRHETGRGPLAERRAGEARSGGRRGIRCGRCRCGDVRDFPPALGMLGLPQRPPAKATTFSPASEALLRQSRPPSPITRAGDVSPG